MPDVSNDKTVESAAMIGTAAQEAGSVAPTRFRCECGGQHFTQTVLLAQTPARGPIGMWVDNTEQRFLCVKCSQVWSPAGDGMWQKEG